MTALLLCSTLRAAAAKAPRAAASHRIPGAECGLPSRRITERYEAATGTHKVLCRGDRANATGRNIGAACFEWSPGTEVDLALNDASGLPIGAWATYTGSHGRVLGPPNHGGGRGWPICGRGVIPTVSGWRTLRVHLGALSDIDACSLLAGVQAPATAGVVRASFTTGWWTPQATPLRAGTIIDGENATGPVGGCDAMPDCAAWRLSGCDPSLAGRNPALYSSIVDVADIADGITERAFEARPGNPVGAQLGGMLLEFWDRQCHKVPLLDSWWAVNCHGLDWACDANFVLPTTARWMTVTSNGNVLMRWTLSNS